jgi:uncharacterized protein YegP (UPF0339 family)
MKYEYGKSSRNRQWYWHLKADNGEKIAQGEGYIHKQDVEHVIRLLKSSANSPVVNLTPREP